MVEVMQNSIRRDWLDDVYVLRRGRYIVLVTDVSRWLLYV